MRIGLLQTTSIGDIVIAAPIAQYFVAQGHQVLWPVSDRYQPYLAAAFPGIDFVSLAAGSAGYESLGHLYLQPMAMLRELGCDRIHCLYSHLVAGEGFTVKGAVNRRLAGSLKFDEYKYAVAGVPFERKWALSIERDVVREQALLARLDLKGEYVLIHEQGSNFKVEVNPGEAITRDHRIVRIEPLTGNPFDWLGVIESAAMLFLIDSVFANLVEQLGIGRNKTLILRSGIQSTPVFRSDWRIV